ncbi:hypothetical protein [Flammeovirga pacifica]|uniref:Uncharacterized protein n=1 Tax=Flammeovirga pacifica TaxID=915059 RepID=A0A1S1YY28_FLAPC|nr:hypothetical protein [Flammeovirga pacifica]OHX65890.1 hypothetical protein NH26_05745 [Flammeovirga pacifica]
MWGIKKKNTSKIIFLLFLLSGCESKVFQEQYCYKLKVYDREEFVKCNLHRTDDFSQIEYEYENRRIFQKDKFLIKEKYVYKMLDWDSTKIFFDPHLEFSDINDSEREKLYKTRKFELKYLPLTKGESIIYQHPFNEYIIHQEVIKNTLLTEYQGNLEGVFYDKIYKYEQVVTFIGDHGNEVKYYNFYDENFVLIKKIDSKRKFILNRIVSCN